MSVFQQSQPLVAVGAGFGVVDDQELAVGSLDRELLVAQSEFSDSGVSDAGQSAAFGAHNEAAVIDHRTVMGSIGRRVARVGTVVDTFEAIRLSLNAPKTAFVVALHRALAEAAVDAAFVEPGRLNGRGLGHDYLEKMLQLQIVVPSRSDDDAASYVGLLLAGTIWAKRTSPAS